MSRRLTFRQADVSRALKGAINAGFDVGRVEIDQTGRIVILPKVAEEAKATGEIQDWFERHARKA